MAAPSTIHEFTNPPSVHTPLGEGVCIVLIDYGCMINSCWMVKLLNGEIKHFDSNDIRMYGNPTYNHDLVPDIPADWKDAPVKKQKP